MLIAAVVALPASAIAQQSEFHAGPFQLFVVAPREILHGIFSAPWEDKVAKPVPAPAPVAPAVATGPAPVAETQSDGQAPTVEEQHKPTSSYFGPQRPYRQQ